MTTKFTVSFINLDPLAGLSEIEKEWASIKKMIYKAKPKKALNFQVGKFRENCRLIIKSKYVLAFFQFLSVLNIVIFTLYWNRQDYTMVRILSSILFYHIKLNF